jgi:hypothetical protein
MKAPTTLAALVTVAALTASCGGSAEDTSASAATSPAVSTGGSSARETNAAAADEGAADPLEGQWRSSTVTPRQVTRNLRGAGLGGAARTVVADQGYPTGFTLVLQGGRYRLTTRDGGEMDVGTYEVDGDRLHLVAAETGHGPTLRWTREGDSLDLVFVESDGTPYKGIPDEAFARPLYDVPVYRLAG